MRIAVIQTERLKDLGRAFDEGCFFLKKALEDRPELIVMPEMWLTGFDVSEESLKVAQEFLSFAESLLKDKTVVALVGTFPEEERGKVFNTAFIRYKDKLYRRRKRCLFEPMGETELYGIGDFPEVFDFGSFKLGVLICYELRFPELSRKLALEGAHIIVVPAQWPKARVEHWRILLKARAVENQLFVVGVNVVGKGKRESFVGYSGVHHPLGETVLEVGCTKGVFVCEIDFDDLKPYRENVPVLKDVRRYLD